LVSQQLERCDRITERPYPAMSDRRLPSTRLRTMTRADIPGGMRLKEIAGWNQTAADWERFLSSSPQGCSVAEVDGRVCGTATTISYEGRFAWVGMVLVDPEFRGRGIGTKLLERAIEHLDTLRIPTVKLDATPLGRPLYEKLGFTFECEIERCTLKRPTSQGPNAACSELRPSLSPEDLEAIGKADREIFGADRSSLLKSLYEDAPVFAAGLWNAGSLSGYAFGRRGSFADHLGPLMSRDPDTARRLLEAFVERSSRETLVVDCLKSNADAVDLLKSFGFSYSRPLTRMYRGANDYPGRPELLCAIMGPEFG
jgi:GNAT superfamily N-acetyltransferase